MSELTLADAISLLTSRSLFNLSLKSFLNMFIDCGLSGASDVSRVCVKVYPECGSQEHHPLTPLTGLGLELSLLSVTPLSVLSVTPLLVLIPQCSILIENYFVHIYVTILLLYMYVCTIICFFSF